MRIRYINHRPIMKARPTLDNQIGSPNPVVNDLPPLVKPEEEKVTEYHVKEVTQHHRDFIHHHFYIGTPIHSDEKWYYPLLQCLNKATEHDTITIYLNTPGGSVYNTTQIVSSINMCLAKVHLVVQGQCASGGTIIAFAGNYDTITIDPYTHFLFHNASMFTYGKLNELHDVVSGMRKLIDELCRDAFSDILTKEELNDVLVKDRELYLTGKDINARLDALSAKQKQEEVRKEQRRENRKKKTSSNVSK